MAAWRGAKQINRSGSMRPPFDCVALLLQGGGALGAYQGGVYEAMAEVDLHPDWMAGISIGAINSAIIAGNPPDARVGKLRTFWETISNHPFVMPFSDMFRDTVRGEAAHSVFNEISANMALMTGAEGFFKPRLPGPLFEPPGSLEATSCYDTAALKDTLETLIDFDRINQGGVRLSIGAVNVRTGNFTYFDSEVRRIGPEHIMASGALPPGFPAIEIEGESYWDGGLVSNTPLSYVMEEVACKLDLLAFQVDLWSARGEFPRHLGEVAIRQKEIQYSSRTRATTDYWTDILRKRSAVAELLDRFPSEIAQTPQAKMLAATANRNVYNLVHLIYRSKRYESNSKDYEFSRFSMEEHWKAGYMDAVRTLRHGSIFERPTGDCIKTFDFLD